MPGEPLFPQYRKPPKIVLIAFVLAGLVLAAVGVNTAFISGSGSCTGRVGLLCLLASALSEVLFGAPNLHLAEGALWFAFALLCWSLAWQLYTMWFKPRR